ncbi:hypothetical protein BK132_31920 [Paenibacillus sp. FSL H8-0259]|nr:hypothetical protein BK132_31920 [Paenibacillus sp. FSL H8-0259]
MVKGGSKASDLKKVSELHTELGMAPKDAMPGSPVTEIGYKRNGRTRRGGPGNMSANRGGTTKLIQALVLKITILRAGAFLRSRAAGRRAKSNRLHMNSILTVEVICQCIGQKKLQAS